MGAFIGAFLCYIVSMRLIYNYFPDLNTVWYAVIVVVGLVPCVLCYWLSHRRVPKRKTSGKIDS